MKNHIFIDVFVQKFLTPGKIIAFAGFPNCGKTTLINHLIKNVTDVVVLPTEVCCFDRQYRQQIGISGCNPKSYDIKKYYQVIKALIEGNEIELPKYDFLNGKQSGLYVKTRLCSNSILILDGTITCLPEIAKVTHTTFFFVPNHLDNWKKSAINRDISERNYEFEQAEISNNKKLEDCINIYQNHKDQIDYLVSTNFNFFEKNQELYNYSILENKPQTDLYSHIPSLKINN